MKLTGRRKYIVLANDLRRKLRSGRFSAEGKLPAERELCIAYDCSRGTVRQALQHLANQGLVRARRGAGTFASHHTGRRAGSSIVCIVPNVMNSEIARFVHTLSAELVERGHGFDLKVTSESVKNEQAIIDDVVRSSVFGVFKFPTQIAYEHDVRARLREAGIPCVVINDFWADCSLDHHVAYDEQAGMKMAVDHLVELGHERIGLLDSHISPRVRAINAYRDALRSHGLSADEKLILLGDPSQIPALDRLYHKGGINPTALITVYDVIAVRVVAGLRLIGLRVPEDVSVANTNGEPLAMGHMDFTTAVLPDQKIIRCALEILETCAEDAPVRHEIITPDFHVGRSTARCAEQPAAAAEPSEKGGGMVQIIGRTRG